MKVMVIGGTGFIGRRVVRLLAQRGHGVVSADLLPLPEGEMPGDVISVRVDIADFEQTMSCMAIHRPEVVVNLSYMRDTTPRAAFRVNVLGMDNCFEAARLCGVRHVVYSSSIAVNGRQAPYGQRKILETDAPYPLTQYANHKVFNEYQASEYHKKHGLRITGLRAAHIAGSDKLIGSVDHVLCIVKAARGEKVVLEHADQMRCVVHVDDIAEVFVTLALSEAAEHAIYNSGGETVSLAEIADMVRQTLPEADITFRHRSGGEPISTAYRFDNARLQSEFGVQYPPYARRVAQMIAEIRASVDVSVSGGKSAETVDAIA
jgi:nucleoside-diphosphate-sugar epimerase